MPETFNFDVTFVFTHTLRREIITNDYGDGYYQSMSSEVAANRYDGSGNPTSHKGIHIFEVNIANVNKSIANSIWTFLLARLNLNNEAFYFYNPEENMTRTGDVGKYLVRLADPNQSLSREFQRVCVLGYSNLVFVETRT